jgi:MFS family permease
VTTPAARPRVAASLTGAYLPLLRDSEARRLGLGGVVGRLRDGGVSLAIVLAVRHASGSFALAGTAAAAYAIAAAASRPVQGRWVDRAGAGRVLTRTTAANCVALVALAVSAAERADIVILLPLAGLIGLTVPPLSAALRALWPTVMPEHRESAYALDTLLYELSLVIAPARVGVMTSVASPALALLVLAICGASGTWLVAGTHAASAGGVSSAHGAVGSIRTRVFAMLALITLFVGAAEGSLVVLVPAFTAAHHSPSSSGLPLSALAVGSLIGALAYGARRWSATTSRRLLASTLPLALCLVALATLAHSILALALLLALAGLALSPTLTTLFLAVQQASPPGALAEAFTWASLAGTAGAAGGQALAGALIAGPGLSAALWIPAGGAALALALSPLASAARAPTPQQRSHPASRDTDAAR